MAYEMIWEPKGLYRRFYGRMTDAELMESVVLTHASPHFDEMRYVILDTLGVEEFVATDPAFIAELAAIDSASALTNPHIRVAVVTDSPEFEEYVAAYNSDPLCAYHVLAFGTLAEARKWAAAPHYPYALALSEVGRGA